MPRPVLWSLAFFTLTGAQSLGAQALPDSPAGPMSTTPLRRATLLGGIGNSLGWLGGQGEIYFTGDRYSRFGAVGYTPSLDQRCPDVRASMVRSPAHRARRLA